MNILKKALVTAAIMATTTLSVTAAYDIDITVRLDGLVNGEAKIVSFDSFRPIQIDNSTFVPARAVAEAAGMTVEWDQASQTALITLNADENSDMPVERYGAELINMVSGYDGLDLSPLNITAALKLYDRNAVIRYNFLDEDGDVLAIGKVIEMSNEARLVDDAALMIPLRNAMELFGLDIEWHQETLTAEVSIPNIIAPPSDLKIIANHASPQETNAEANADINLGEYIGTFKITKYCPCDTCNGGWGNHTAWAEEIIPGQTVAVDPDVIGKLRWIYIDGIGLRRAEDCGGAVKGHHIDLAVGSHEEATSGTITYRDVYYAE